MKQWAAFYMLRYFMTVVTINNSVHSVVSTWASFPEPLMILLTAQGRAACLHVTH